MPAFVPDGSILTNSCTRCLIIGRPKRIYDGVAANVGLSCPSLLEPLKSDSLDSQGSGKGTSAESSKSFFSKSTGDDGSLSSPLIIYGLGDVVVFSSKDTLSKSARVSEGLVGKELGRVPAFDLLVVTVGVREVVGRDCCLLSVEVALPGFDTWVVKVRGLD